ncbi:MAG: hypothetical protein ACRCWR_00095, partial [Saezia sp.]
ITLLEAKLNNANGAISAIVTCDECDVTKYQYAWVINGLTVGTGETYTPTAADDGFNIRIEVTGQDVYGQKTSAYRVYGGASKVKKIIGTEWTYAALKADGSVISWGQLAPADIKVEFKDVAEELKSGVVEIFSSKNAFAALKKDGSVVTWGGSAGGDSRAVQHRLKNVKKIIGTEHGMIALTHDNLVVTWAGYQGREPATNDVIDIYATRNSTFLALLHDGSVKVFGSSSGTYAPTSLVKSITTNAWSFAILREDGSVECGGFDTQNGGKCDTFEQLKAGVVEVVSSPAISAFVARLKDNSVFTWGNFNYSAPNIKSIIPTASMTGRGPGQITYIGSDDKITVRGGLRVDKYPPGNFVINKVYANLGAFAATDSAGSITTWGYNRAGAEYSLYLTDIVDIKGANEAFIALDKDGNAFEWGKFSGNGFADAPDYNSYIKGNLIDIESIYGAPNGFSIVKKNGAILSWGTTGRGNSANPTIEDREKLLNMRNQISPITDTIPFVLM